MAIWLGTPHYLGETRIFSGVAHYKIKYGFDYWTGTQYVRHSAVVPNEYTIHPEDFDHDVTIIFTAVSV